MVTATVGFFVSVRDRAPMAMIPIDDEVRRRVVGLVGRRVVLLRHISRIPVVVYAGSQEELAVAISVH